MTIYNGFGPGESRTVRSRPRKEDAGHSVVAMTTTRKGHSFTFRYTLECQCGRVFSGQTQGRPHYAHAAHVRTHQIMSSQRCEALAKRGTGRGICGELLDNHGVCPKAGAHIEEES